MKQTFSFFAGMLAAFFVVPAKAEDQNTMTAQQRRAGALIDCFTRNASLRSKRLSDGRAQVINAALGH